MKKSLFLFLFIFSATLSFSQNVGIVRKNYFSTYYDSTLMMIVDVLDSSTIRLGSINPTTGVVTHTGSSEYALPINLTGATLNPYSNQYYIGSGTNLLTFDITSGDIINSVPITGALPSFAFQNLRFNPGDSMIYGMIPQNYYSTYYDSSLMMFIDVLDSARIRFASIDPVTGQYTIIGNSSFGNLYTLAGNSIDPYQMVYYYSAVDTLIGIDLYTGAQFNAVPIQVPAYSIFENIAYSCADSSIYGLTRRNYVSTVYDSILMTFEEVIDSTTFQLSKIDPNTGVVTFISPANIGAGGNLSGGSFIDPNTMTYYFSNGNRLIGVSMITGLITSSVSKSFPSGEIAFDMMRGTQNCVGAARIRFNNTTAVNEIADRKSDGNWFPNPSQNLITLGIKMPFTKIEVMDYKGSMILESTERTIDISSLPSGIYFSKTFMQNGEMRTGKFIKN